MKNLNKIINIILVSLTCVVATIFIFGAFKKSNFYTKSADKSAIYKTDQSSFSENTASVPAQNVQDELTNKYMKELQARLKKDELESANQIKKVRIVVKNVKNKNDDWSQVSAEQQVTKNDQFESRQTSSVAKGNSGSVYDGVTITKDNAAEFVETARKNGYHVILSSNYEVVSVTPIMNTKGISDSFETNPEN
jgi:hypothetical protein